MNSSQRGSPERGASSAPASSVRVAPRRRRSLLAVRGALAATALGAYTILGALGAFLALLPAALRPVPRGRAPSAPTGSRAPAPAAEASREPLAG